LIRAVIFDFDGLIIDTETAWYEAYKETLNAYQAEIQLEEFGKCIGTDESVLFTYFRKQLGESCNVVEIETKASEIHKVKMETVKAREGVKEYLEEAKHAGYRIALASSSSKEWVTYFLSKLDLINYFEAIITRNDVKQVKPAPDLYIKAIQTLNIEAGEAVAFEDSLNGLQAAVAAGLKCVIVPNPVTEMLDFEKFDLRLKSMADKNLAEVINHIEDQAKFEIKK
jgi:putative hydrolase of the HAD superfamily